MRLMYSPGHWMQNRACLASGHQNGAARYPGVLFNCEFCRSVLLVPLRLPLRTRLWDLPV